MVLNCNKIQCRNVYESSQMCMTLRQHRNRTLQKRTSNRSPLLRACFTCPPQQRLRLLNLPTSSNSQFAGWDGESTPSPGSINMQILALVQRFQWTCNGNTVIYSSLPCIKVSPVAPFWSRLGRASRLSFEILYLLTFFPTPFSHTIQTVQID